MTQQLSLDLTVTRPARIGFIRGKDRRYHTRRYPAFDRTTSQLYREVSERGSLREGEGKRG